MFRIFIREYFIADFVVNFITDENIEAKKSNKILFDDILLSIILMAIKLPTEFCLNTDEIFRKCFLIL
jgi:hypothetical protein